MDPPLNPVWVVSYEKWDFGRGHVPGQHIKWSWRQRSGQCLDTSQGTPKIATRPPEAREEAWDWLLSPPPGGTSPANTTVPDFWLPELGDNVSLLSKPPSEWLLWQQSRSEEPILHLMGTSGGFQAWQKTRAKLINCSGCNVCSVAQLCPTLYHPIACQAPLSMGLSWQEHCSRWPFPHPGDLPNPGIEPTSPASPALAGRLFTMAPCGNPALVINLISNQSPWLLLLAPSCTWYLLPLAGQLHGHVACAVSMAFHWLSPCQERKGIFFFFFFLKQYRFIISYLPSFRRLRAA